MTEHSDKHLAEIAYCYLGDARNNMGNSLMSAGCKFGMDVGLCAPESLWPTRSSSTVPRARRGDGARLTLTSDVDEGVKGVDYLYTDVWVSMGEDPSVWEERIALLKPYQVNGEVIKRTGNPNVKFLHCLPAFHNRETKVGEEIFETYGLDGMEVTDEVFESSTRSCSTRPRTACTRSRPSWSPPWATDRRRGGVRVVALGGNALLKRGEPMTATSSGPTCGGGTRPFGDRRRTRAGALARQRPQVGCSRCRARVRGGRGYPLDVLGAQTEGMIGYVLSRSSANAAPEAVATS
jgi:hypothetical protein